MSRNLFEPVGLRFRGRERFLPLLALAAAFRQTVEEVARGLVILIDGPDVPPALPSPDSSSSPANGEGGKGGGERSETFGSETFEPETEESERERSQTFRRAHEGANPDIDAIADSIAHALGDDVNVAAIRKLVSAHPEDRVRDALTRTLAIPAERIRGSRGAVFTGIVRKLASERTSPPTP